MAKRKGKKKADEYEDEPESFEEEESQALVPAESEALAERDDTLYLDSSVTGNQAIVLLAPPDLSRCQCEWRDVSHDLSFGPKPLIRCDDEPTVIAFQKRDPDDEQPTGAVSLCDAHKAMVEHMHPDQCYFRRITSDKKIGDFA